MESSEDDDDFTYHEGITPQAKINSLYQSNTEKGIRKLCGELLDLKDAVENLCGNTRAKHLGFLRLSEEVVEMEHELSDLRKHISAQGILVQDLMSGLCQELAEWTKTDGHEDPLESQSFELEYLPYKDTNDPKRIFLEKMDILLAEHRALEALEALDLEEKSSPELRSSGEPAFLKRKAVLEEQLVAIADQPSLGDAELKKTLLGLLKLGKGPLAHQILLRRYASRLRKRIEAFVPSCSLYPATYPAALSKITFSFVSLAAKETASTFGDDPVYKNRMVQWAEQELESFVRLVKESGPPSESDTALHAASVCVQASLSNCGILESQGLRLSKLLMLLLRPYVEEVLEMNFRRARRVLLSLVENESHDADPPLSPRFLSPLSGFASSSDSLLISSAMKFIAIVKEIVELLTPPAILEFGGSVLNRISLLFDNYVDLLIRALPSPSEDDGITELKEALPFKAETDSQQLTLLGIAYSIVDELLPMAVSRIWNVQMESHDQITGSVESNVPAVRNAVDFKEWRRQLQHSLDKLRDYFCRQYVLNFIYSREGKARLDARIYVDGEDEDVLLDSDPLPSLPFQDHLLWTLPEIEFDEALFGRLQQLATVAGDVLLGKEKLQKVLLARLTETIAMWLSDEQEFWGVFEDESIALKPCGLQQLILDMHFTVEIARFAGYSSRQVLQLASEIITRAVKTFSAKGIDPQSTLPEDEWFSETAKAAINKLLLGASGSEASEPEEEPVYVRHHHMASAIPVEEEPDYEHHHLSSDSDDSISCPSTVDSFHSFVSAEMGDLESPPDFTDHES